MVTGLGAITPLGLDHTQSWAAALAGRSGISHITRFDASAFPVRIAGEVKGFDPIERLGKKAARQMDRFIQLAVVAAQEAAAHAGLPQPLADPTRVGVLVGVGLCGLETLEEAQDTLREKGVKRVSPFVIPRLIANLAPGQISIALGARGPNLGSVSACASGAHSIGEAARHIRWGDADVMIAGGAEATITSLGIAGFAAMRALSTRNDDPAAASRPFDRERDGFVCAEGAGILVLESLEHARRRGAEILAELVGYGQASDAYHMTKPDPSGLGPEAAMRLALKDAALDPRLVGYVNAHGTSTAFNDAVESQAIRRVFGAAADQLWVSSTKSMTGHMLGAAGGVEAVFTVLSLLHGEIPPTINYEHPDPDCDLDYVPNVARARRLDAALSNSFGFGGTNVSLIFRRYRG